MKGDNYYRIRSICDMQTTREHPITLTVSENEFCDTRDFVTSITIQRLLDEGFSVYHSENGILTIY